MRRHFLLSIAAGTAVSALAFTGASAGGWDCNCGYFGGAAVYSASPTPGAYASYPSAPYYGTYPWAAFGPIGYVIDPSDARPPIYVVNQGPTYSGWSIYARPTYSEGRYAYAQPYPWYGGRGWYKAPRVYRHPGYGSVFRPFSAYALRVQPNARVIQVAPR